MPFIHAKQIQKSINRLRSSAAGTSLGDFLVFKRAQVLSGGPDARVITGTKSLPFLAAHLELASLECYHFSDTADLDTLEDPKAEYFVPFGMNDSSGGYRTMKFASNGPSDSVARWSNRAHAPFEYVKGTSRPKEYRYVSRNVDELQRFFFGHSGHELSERAIDRPALEDLAIWWFRCRDLDEVSEGEDGIEIQWLVDWTTGELGLTETEVEALFDGGASNSWAPVTVTTESDTAEKFGGEQ